MRPELAALARDGVLTRDALVAAGLNPFLGDIMVRRGRWAPLAPSVWLTGAAPADDRALVAAALAHLGTDAVVTGLVAARAHGLREAPVDGTVEVLVPAGRRRVGSTAIRVRPTVRPPRRQVGSPYAEPVRAVVDGARYLGELRAVRALLCEAVTGPLVSVADLAAELEAGGSAGSAVVRRAIADVAEGAWSAPEAELADHVRDAVRLGLLPPFLLNPVLLIDGRFLARPDGWFPGLGLGWEVDSWQHHGDRDTFDATLARHDRFASHGLGLVHVTPRRLRRVGPAYVEVLARAVQARRAAHLPEPAGLVVVRHDAYPAPQRARRLAS